MGWHNLKIMYNNQVNAMDVPTAEPDFSRVLSLLRENVAQNQSLAEKTSYLANGLKPMLQPGEGALGQKEEPGIIGMLFAEIFKLRACNESLERTYKHMVSVIGT